MRHVYNTLALVCAEFSILLQWLQLILDNRPHDKNLDIKINDIQNGIYADNDFIPITLTHDTLLSLKFVHPCLQSDRHVTSRNITSDTESYTRPHRHPREVPAQYSLGCQLSNRLPIYTPMDRNPT